MDRRGTRRSGRIGGLLGGVLLVGGALLVLRPVWADPPSAGAASSSGSSVAAAPAESPPSLREAPRPLPAAEAGIGRLIPDAACRDSQGRTVRLTELVAGSPWTVLAFTNATCPLCRKYAPVLARLEKEYAPRGVAFVFVNPTQKDKPDDVPFAGRYLLDTPGKLRAALGATSTTEVFVLDQRRTLRYRGAVDDQYGLGYALESPRQRYLAAALDELLAGRSPTVAATTAPGCVLEKEEAASAPTVPLTYHARIERIIQVHCLECHRQGGVAPFSLETYDDVAAHRGMIRRVVMEGRMPPWLAAPPPAGQPSPFLNDRRLPEADRRDLLAWLASDRPQGDPADAPLPLRFASGWTIGQPDVIYQLPQPIAVKAEGTMPYQNVFIDTEFEEDRWVQALEVQPTAREVVHHVLVFTLPPGSRRIVGGETTGFFAAYVPGNNKLIYPPGYAKKLPKKAVLRFQIHYTPNGKPTTDQTRLGLIFAKEKPRYEVQVAAIANLGFRIPPGAENHEVSARLPVPFDVRLLALFPHAHLRGKAARYELRTPDGTVTTLLHVPRYDFNWQLEYRFAQPVAVPRGSTLIYRAWYDNSANNPANPDPTRTVRWGEQTYDEMHLGYVEYVVDGLAGRMALLQGGLGGNPGGPPPADVRFPPEGVPIPERFQRLFQRFDTNGDKRIDPKEFEQLPPFLQNGVLEYLRANPPPAPPDKKD
ncbi:MAG: redoxin domain-containing protein [Gemmataceae bacterium]|uniref:Redoxin domain-containing protein n=1 Tax=Thermogemmata fonticola TaxID=2755323 RepID=A0A7V9ACE2_9BACT|nr:redoxin domain-containing protein [Thermogemmata fonticola]MBA2226943.1 redoxin domain-containing protein [Thermogemmata fonticola]MCX8139776.1 redoxin domain-containing protein [Gemmataceae bacterium]